MAPPLRIAFMGTPHFSVPALQALIASPNHVVAVYTQPPKPVGRGHEVQKTPIHKAADAYHIPVYHPTSLRTTDAAETFASLDLDIAVVAAYGLLLPKAILDTPRLGCINIHASLLPRWRGAAPLQYALLEGDTASGITLMKMDEGMDTGPMIAKSHFAITDHTTLTQLHDALSAQGCALLMEHLDAYCAGQLTPTPQPLEGITHAPKITKELGRLQWHASAQSLCRKVRALNPWPGTYFHYNNQVIKVLAADVVDQQEVTNPVGTVLDDCLAIQCGFGIFKPTVIQKAGGKPMDTRSFLRGHPIPSHTILAT